MGKLFLIAGFVFCGAAASANSPVADIICDDRQALLKRLERAHGAKRQGTGMRGPDAVLEVWAVPSTGDWTIVQSYANGRSCIVAMGENWEGEILPADPA